MKHVGPISGIATYGDTYVATAGYDNQVILWEGRTKRAIARVFHDHLANQCSFSPDGRFLASASSDYTARLWEVPTMRLVAVFSGHEDDVEMVAFSPDGERVATCARDHTIKLFDLTGRELSRLIGHTNDINSVSWMADGVTLVSTGDDGTVRRWDTRTSTELSCATFEDHDVDTNAVTEDGVIFVADHEGRISVINGDRVTIVPAHKAGIKRIVYDARTDLLVSMSYDRTLTMWARDGDGLVARHNTSIPDIVWPRSCAFFGDSHLALGSFGSTYALYDYTTGEWDLDGIEQSVGFNAVYNAGDHVYAVGDAGLVHEDGRPMRDLGELCNFVVKIGDHLLTGGQSGRVFDAYTGRMLFQNHAPLNCGVVFDRGGVQHAAVCTYTGDALIFRLLGDGGIEYVETVQLHDNAIKGVSAADGTIFSVCATGAGACHRIADFECLERPRDAHTRIANGCVAVRPGLFASVGRDLKLRLWQRGETVTIDTPHTNSIKCITASPDGRFIATGSYVGVVAVYDLEREEWANVERPTAAGISCLAPGTTTDTFLASSYDGRVYTIPARNEALVVS